MPGPLDAALLAEASSREIVFERPPAWSASACSCERSRRSPARPTAAASHATPAVLQAARSIAAARWPGEPRLADGDRDALDVGVRVAADVPRRRVGLQPARRVAGAAAQDVLAGLGVPRRDHGAHACGPGAGAELRLVPRRAVVGAHLDAVDRRPARPRAAGAASTGPASTKRLRVMKSGMPGGDHERARVDPGDRLARVVVVGRGSGRRWRSGSRRTARRAR